ncbi:hypothetical protein COU15_03060 [Candidatus Kaiserbacteria bacterium CG10_big_fil_rev_8_21_14_0_10_45_20]|uniref:Uncharacterized protein n=1 Tax=Candidatus Kaiserbacteria bacterium CG10_big_fil_rev_8_21_14_0_10_45_20 TaxID=1974607 RepID=A0A2H0UFA2_9BACT|nr:MAG: hypothetical protein COU15_03060 [Candidatus Kaiserbacteria bacterium CG10_big_fil_rev_8_21_14_0_10_45_20]
MKVDEKKKAILLRKKGESIKEIARVLGVSKGSVSLWVRDILLTKQQRSILTARGFSKDAIEKRRLNRIGKTDKRHAIVFDAAKDSIQEISSRELWLIAVALYWGEGGKTRKGLVRISNSDPDLLRMIMRFFREVEGVPEEKFRCHVHTFSHLNAKKAEKYWSQITHIPLTRFYKTYVKQSTATQQKRDTTPYGTAQIYICDTALYLKMMGWIGRLRELSL